MSDRLIHSRFEKRAAADPSALAVVCGGQSLSYGELNARANQLARTLAARGVRPGDLIAVWGTRSLETLINLLGVVKAGGAFLPLDPANPAERLSFTLNDSAARLLLTAKGCDVPSLTRATDTIESSAVAPIGPQDEINADPIATADDLAYVMYTSGSTGQPKGVMIEHAAVVNTLDDINERFSVSKTDRVLCLSSFAFDLSVYDVFGVLGAGGAVVLPDDAAAREPATWAGLIDTHQVTLWNTVPALMELLASYREATHCPPLLGVRLAMLSGDWIPVSLPNRVRALMPGAKVVSLGGATEASIWSIWYPIDRVDPTWSSIPYGKALRHQSFYILDEAHRPCAVGTPGELYTGGCGVARGYLNRPELTAERFVDDPFSNQPAARMFRTGDRGRWCDDGNIEFLGRIDNQIKINGNRIELGEIETALARHPQIRDAVVVAPRDAAGRRRLAAFYVAATDAEPQEQDLLAWLARQLPTYMLPQQMSVRQSLPLTANGKVDRQALAEDSISMVRFERPVIQPRNDVERRVAAVWQAVLKSPTVSVSDRFVENGDSLAMVDLMLRINAIFNIELPVATPHLAATIADLAERVSAAERVSRPKSVRRDFQRDDFPASPGQQQLWAVEQMRPRNPAYNVAALYRLRGQLDPSALTRALSAIVLRHEPLRTSVRMSDSGMLRQIVNPHQEFAIPVIDLREFPLEQREAIAESKLNESARELFDLASDRLLRAILVRMGPEEHQLLITMHHIASDGWSLGLLHLELASLYDAFCRGAAPELPPLPTTYVDYTLQLEERLHCEHHRRLNDYWHKQLAGPLPLLELPTDHPRPATVSNAGATHSFTLPEPLVTRLKRLANEEGAALFTVLLAGFNVLLARYSDQTDIIVGSPVAGRNSPDVARLIGYFVNVLALRVDLSGNPTVRELVQRVKTVAAEGFLHQDLPLVHLASRLDFDRQAGDRVPFRTMFVLHNQPTSPLELPGIDVTMRMIDTGTAKADLVLSLTENLGAIEAALEYRTDLFSPDGIDRLAKHWLQLLAAAVEQPDGHIGQLAILTDEETRLFDSWNNTITDYPRTATIHQLFEHQVCQTPTAPALVFDDKHWTYAELNDRADQIARRLRAAGITATKPVGVCLRRSPELVACLLGILKAGGVYVPLDLAYPPQRLKFMALDADVRLIVTMRQFARELFAGDRPVVFLDDDAPLAEVATRHRGHSTTAEDAAYILYTSGSTGQPKGVTVPHRAVVRLVKNTNYLQFTPQDVFFQFAPVSFDASTLEIWGPLLNGGRLVIAPPRDISLAGLGALIRKHRVSTLWLTAGLFHSMVDQRLEDLVGVKYLLSGGDVLSPDHVRRALTALPNTTVINGYGPTENTTFTTCHAMSVVASLRPGSVPIGRPIANSQIYILDRNQQQTPIGVPGEIHCGGDGLALGYENRPELNEQCFIEYRRPDGSTVKVYKTGDLGQFLPDGTVQFLGRRDHQFKIRGFRIEAAEIEAALCRHPIVQQAAVVVTRDSTLRKQLAAYVAVGAAAPLPAKDFQMFLRGALPHYMVPTQFVCLDELPLDANGKVNRSTLPPVPKIVHGISREYSAPRDDVERRLAKIWEATFDLEAADMHDDFFALGGDSLLAVSLLARVDQEFNSSLQLTDLVQHPTIADLAARLRNETEPTTSTMAVEIQPGGALPNLFFAPCIHGNLMTIRGLAARLDVEQPVYGLQPVGMDGLGMPLDSISRLADHYLQQVRHVQPCGPYYLSGYSLGGTIAFEMAQQLTAAGETVPLLILIDAPHRARPLFLRWAQRMLTPITKLAAAASQTLMGPQAVPIESLVDKAMLVAHMRALREYRARPYEGPVVILRAMGRSHGLKRVVDSWTQDWKGQRLVGLETLVVWTPGGHESMFSVPHVDVLAEHVQRHLRAAMNHAIAPQSQPAEA
jgi:amino acid adenylation domain-containing protein